MRAILIRMNPAARLLKIYDTLMQQPADQQPMSHVWAKVFGLDINSPHLEDDATACAVALRQQIDFTRTRLSVHSVPAELTHPGFDRLKNTASPSNFHAAWNSHRDAIQRPECRHAFTWASWVLRDEAEADMPPDDLVALRTEIESLEKSLSETELSPYLRDFIQRQVDTIRAALQVYGVRGVRPLQEALQRAVGAYAVERAHVEAEYAAAPEGAKGLFAKTGETLKKTAEVCDSLDKIKRFGENAVSLAASVAPLVLPYISK